MSGFIPRHIEQPARRHSKPASRKTASSPSSSACAPHGGRSGDDERGHPVRDAAAANHLCGGAQVLDARVGAGADEDAVDGDLRDRRACAQPHVLERALGREAVVRVGVARGVGDGAVDRRDHARGSCPTSPAGRAPRRRPRGARRRSRSGSVGSDRQRSTAALPVGSVRCTRAPLEVGERGLVGCDHARPSRPTRSTCCRSSCAPPSRARGRRARRTRRRGRRRPTSRAGRSRRGSCPSRSRRAAARPTNSTSIVLGRRCGSVCVASTCSTSEVPIPNASAPKAPWVEVCESPQTIVLPGCVSPSSGPITWTIPSLPEPVAWSSIPNSSQFARKRVELRPAASSSVIGPGWWGRCDPSSRSSARGAARGARPGAAPRTPGAR